MTSRRIIPLAITLALLPLLPVPAEPGGGGVGMREQKMKQEQLKEQPQPQAQTRAKIAESQAELKNTVGMLGKTRGDMSRALKKSQALNTSARSHLAAALKATPEGGAVRKSLEAAMKDLEAQDKLGNFEIQDLMSRYNQAETLASSVQKKLDDTAKGIAGKI